MNNLINEIIKTISKFKFQNLNNEKLLQNEIFEALNSFNIFREVKLSDKDIIDFVIENNEIKIGIELKIKGSPKQIYRQLERYVENNKLDTIILITNRSMGLPEFINSTPLYFFNLGRSWL